MNRRVHAALALACLGAAGCDTPTLATGAALRLSFEASVLYPANVPAGLPSSKSDCVADGGAVVDLRAWDPDGSPARGAQVTLWLEPAVTARLVPLGQMSCTAVSDDVCIALDEGGEGRACLLPGPSYGSVTVFAHSGAIEQSKTIVVGAHNLASGSTLFVDVAPKDLTTIAPAMTSSCGAPAAAACVPGRARSAQVTVHATSPDGAPPPLDKTVISIDVTAGWLVASGNCDTGTLAAALDTTLSNATASATWCFGDTASSGTFHVRSGAVTASASAVVPAVPASVRLTPSASAVASGGSVTLAAVVTGCDAVGIAGVPVLFQVTQGKAPLSSTAPVATGTDGIATITATVSSSATFQAALALAPKVDCSVDVEMTP